MLFAPLSCGFDLDFQGRFRKEKKGKKRKARLGFIGGFRVSKGS
jgi:hypothetical protein